MYLSGIAISSYQPSAYSCYSMEGGSVAEIYVGGRPVVVSEKAQRELEEALVDLEMAEEEALMEEASAS